MRKGEAAGPTTTFNRVVKQIKLPALGMVPVTVQVVGHPERDIIQALYTAKEELVDIHRDVVDGHLQLSDEVVAVAALFNEDGEKLLLEVIKEFNVRATVPRATL